VTLTTVDGQVLISDRSLQKKKTYRSCQKHTSLSLFTDGHLLRVQFVTSLQSQTPTTLLKRQNTLHSVSHIRINSPTLRTDTLQPIHSVSGHKHLTVITSHCEIATKVDVVVLSKKRSNLATVLAKKTLLDVKAGLPLKPCTIFLCLEVQPEQSHLVYRDEVPSAPRPIFTSEGGLWLPEYLSTSTVYLSYLGLSCQP